jgi:DNA-binding XRE family transcriptional regulator
LGIAARLRAFRVRAGKSQAEMAQRLELNEAWYADLEKHDDLPDRILAHAIRKGISLAQLEQKIGWELREFVDAPVRSATELPIRFFQALAAALGINWLAMLPDEEAA